MTDTELKRLTRITDGPVLRTLRGCRQHIRYLACDDITLLLRAFDCSVEEVDYELWYWSTGRDMTYV